MAVEDAYGNIETADTSTQVTLALSANPGGIDPVMHQRRRERPGDGQLAGVASFTCSLNKAGTGYTLAATSNPAHGTTTSNSFNIVAGTASQLVLSTQPPASTPASSTFGTAVSIEDLYGNVVIGDTHTVTLALSANPCSGTLAGTTSQAAVPAWPPSPTSRSPPPAPGTP